MIDKYLGGGILGGLGLTAVMPDWPTLAAAGTLTAINTVMGISGFAMQFALTAFLPSNVQIALPTLGIGLAPVVAGMGLTVSILVTAARRGGIR
ncbi:hypothetical protein [Halorhabdus sp. CUG00001]|uniref:hypothetical protein n=1 Tax=Halorhabdus sp. CUG00001 TaxID=2600297 RepID=UPI00131B2D8E|nr:hypothetical protein [Halorhabdus sp. CUG00001]